MREFSEGQSFWSLGGSWVGSHLIPCRHHHSSVPLFLKSPGIGGWGRHPGEESQGLVEYLAHRSSSPLSSPEPH